MRPTRNIGLGLTAAVGAAAIPVFGPAALIVIVAVALAFIPIDYAIQRVSRPEYAVLTGTLIPVTAIVALVAARGGAENPAMVLLIIPVVGCVAVLPARGSFLILGYTAATLALATIANTPSSFSDDPRLTLTTLATILIAGLMARRLMISELDQRTRAVLDPLTGLLNRASLADRFAELREQGIRTGTGIALVICDLDRFKLVNDTHGHQVGDAVLQGAAYEMRRSLRSYELIYRLGGEEFLVLLPGATSAQAAQVAETMRAAVAARPPSGIPVSVSFGVSAAEGEEMNLGSMLEAADRALLKAKRRGRDRVIQASEYTDDESRSTRRRYSMV